MVCYLCNAPLHDNKVRIVDVQLNTLKHGLNSVHLTLVAIEEVFRNVR
jgi:hypothetical protein